MYRLCAAFAFFYVLYLFYVLYDFVLYVVLYSFYYLIIKCVHAPFYGVINEKSNNSSGRNKYTMIKASEFSG